MGTTILKSRVVEQKGISEVGILPDKMGHFGRFGGKVMFLRIF